MSIAEYTISIIPILEISMSPTTIVYTPINIKSIDTITSDRNFLSLSVIFKAFIKRLIPLNIIQKPTTILIAFSTVSLKKRNIIASSNNITVLANFITGKGDTFQLINIVINVTAEVSNKTIPIILEIVVTKISGLVNRIPPIIKNIIELIKDDWFL